METRYHSFVDGEAGPCGAILSRSTPRSVRTRTVFKMGAAPPVYLVDHVVEHQGDVRRWTRFDYQSPTSQTRHSGTRDDRGVVHLDGVLAPHLTGAVGAYAEHSILAQMLLDDAETVSYLQFDESEPEQGAVTVELRRRGPEPTTLLDGTVVDAERVDLVVAGRATNAHWGVDGEIVKSDWCGAESFLLDDIDDIDALGEGLDPAVAARIREFVRR